MMRFANGRADLVRALTSACPLSVDEIAALLGYQADEEVQVVAPQPVSFVPGSIPEVVDVPVAVPTPSEVEVSFWQPTVRHFLGEPGRVSLAFPPESQNRPTTSPRASVAPEWPSLAEKPDLMARLRPVLGALRETSALDIPVAISRVATAQQIRPIPRRKRRRSAQLLQVIVDRSRRLVPIWGDQLELYQWLRPQFPHGAVRPMLMGDGDNEPSPIAPDAAEPYSVPPPGTIVLVLGDLGCLATDAGQRIKPWLDLGKRLRMGGCVPVALLPCGPDYWPAALRAVWNMVSWERGGGANRADSEAAAVRLLSLLSLAVRVEPGLLRQVRRLPGIRNCNVAAEIAFWQLAALSGQSSEAATIDSRVANELRQQYWRVEAAAAAETRGLMQQILALASQWRPQALSDVWFEEILSLPEAMVALLPDPADRDLALSRFTRLSLMLDGLNDIEASANLAANLKGLLDRMPPDAMASPHVKPAIDRFAMFVKQMDGNTDDPPPVIIDPANIPANPGAAPRRLTVHHQGGHLGISPPESVTANGSPLTDVTSVNGIISIAGTDLPDLRASFWVAGSPPPWASDWGYDRFGAWASFTIAGVTQRLRWIVPGRFKMGSPKEEPGRFDDEGPVHEVAISQGFWLFDTQCTQALWQVVIGENPSRFRTPDRPVEMVSWDYVGGFLEEINALVPGLSLTLPTEAQWEYACRAGTNTALYCGPIDIEENDTAPALDAIAWYAGNSGRESHPVGLKSPNGWGLYDMLGNVWEWCADGKREYTAAAEIDPCTEMVTTVGRSLRGGSWNFTARYLRAAFRDWIFPDQFNSNIGFRCARGRVGAEPTLPPSPRLAERRGGAGRTAQRPGAAVIEVGTSVARVPLPTAPALIIRSDCEEVHLTQITRPDWASAIGRDRFGLWTRIDINGATQRLRWITPGRFLMGSPDDEPGRFDDEGPVHEVTISRGFWLFDTPCTQALWQAVMGENPSRFQSPDRPVEQVSWNEAQNFIGQINGLVPGLSLSLPTEAQWEYACRAGTQTALYTGPIDIIGENNAPALDPIAWYGGNFGQGFELTNGYDIADWRERQFPDSKGGTHPVGLKAPNGWGLSDMLGNVWEWCADGAREYTTAAAVDPIGLTEDGAPRALRGGSWSDSARFVRAAFRNWSLPDARLGNIGFRCARSQGGAELSLPPSPRLAERRGGAGRTAQRPAGKPLGPKKRK